MENPKNIDINVCEYEGIIIKSFSTNWFDMNVSSQKFNVGNAIMYGTEHVKTYGSDLDKLLEEIMLDIL